MGFFKDLKKSFVDSFKESYNNALNQDNNNVNNGQNNQQYTQQQYQQPVQQQYQQPVQQQPVQQQYQQPVQQQPVQQQREETNEPRCVYCYNHITWSNKNEMCFNSPNGKHKAFTGKEVSENVYVCKCCGHKFSIKGYPDCISSPIKRHIMYAGPMYNCTCMYCGYTNYTLQGLVEHKCTASPTGYCIAKD